jgi:hypothetical protein
MPGEFRIAVDRGIAYNKIAADFGRPRQEGYPEGGSVPAR